MVPMGTSRFFLTVAGVDAMAFRDAARSRGGVWLPRPNPDTGEFFMQVNPTLLRKSPEAVAQALLSAAKG